MNANRDMTVAAGSKAAMRRAENAVAKQAARKADIAEIKAAMIRAQLTARSMRDDTMMLALAFGAI